MENVANRMEQRAAPVLSAAHAILDYANKKFPEHTRNLAKAFVPIRRRVRDIAHPREEFGEGAGMQAARLDKLFHTTADKVQQTTDFLQTSVITPVRRVHAI